MAGRVQKHDVSVIHDDLLDTDVDGDPPSSLLLGLVGHPGELEGLLAHLFGLLLVLVHEFVGDLLDHVHQLADQG